MAEPWWESAPLVESKGDVPKVDGGARPWWEDVPLAETKGGKSDAKPGVMDYVADVGQAIPSGLAKGAAGLVGLPGDMASGIQWLARAGQRQITGMTPEQQDAYLRENALGYSLKDKVPDLGSQGLVSGLESVTGPLYKPKTIPGQYAGTIAEFAPGAVLGGGSALARAGQVAGSAITSETLGQITKDSPYETAARLVGGVTGGVGASLAQRAPAAQRILARSVEGLDPAAIRQAEGLMQRAEQAGIPLTWDEAVSHVTNGASAQLTNVRRVVENSPGGAGVLNPLMAERAGQVARAGERELGSLVPGQPLDSVRTGLRTQQAADGVLADTQTQINAATRPDYLAAERQSITPEVGNALAGDPLYARTLAEIRADPGLNRTIAHLPDDSVGVVDLVQRRLRETAETARRPGEANTSNLRAANLEDARTAPLTAAEAATGGPMGDYARARQTQADLRGNLLEPLEAGPLGTMRGTADVRAQGSALLPDKPAFASEGPAREAIGRLVTRDPEAATNLVHNHLRTAFDEATQNLQSGQNQFGGAKFAAVVRGNGQQAQNLQAVVEQLPNGAQRWNGLNNFLDILEATGTAPRQGSATAFNQEIRKDLGKGGLVSGAAEVAGTGGLAWIKKAASKLDDWNAGRNSGEIARILTNPASGRLLERLASLPPGGHQARVLAMRLAYMGRTGKNSATTDKAD